MGYVLKLAAGEELIPAVHSALRGERHISGEQCVPRRQGWNPVKRSSMSVISMMPSRPSPEAEVELISQLAVALSGRLTRVSFEEISSAIAGALQHIASAMRIDNCQLIEFTASGTVARAHLPARAAAEDSSRMRAPGDWLVERLGRGELVAVSQPDELPAEAIAAREQAPRSGGYSILGVPASVAGQVMCALVIDAAQFGRRWSPPLIERLQLVSEILGGALQRGVTRTRFDRVS